MFNMPPITKNLIIINAIFYFGAVVGVRWGVDLNDILGLHYFMASDFHLYQLFTYMFAHANLTHLAFNMFTLWMFGRTMERTWGPRRFLAFYIICGLGAGLTQEVAQTGSFLVAGLNHYEQVNAGGVLMSMPEYLNAWTTVGASGAIYGLLLAFGVTYSNEYIMLLIPPIPMKAKYMILLFIAFELFSGFYSGGDGVAQHLGEQEPVGLEQVDGVVQPRDEQQQEQGGQGGEPGGFPFQAERFPGKPGQQAQAQGEQGCPEHGEVAELRQEGADERQDAPGLFKEGAQVFPLRAEEGILL